MQQQEERGRSARTQTDPMYGVPGREPLGRLRHLDIEEFRGVDSLVSSYTSVQ